MKLFSVYEAITAGMLSVSIIVAGNSMAHGESVLNREENIIPYPSSVTRTSDLASLITPTPAGEITIKATPLEMLNNEVLYSIDINDMEPAYYEPEDETEDIIAITETDEAIETSDEMISDETIQTETGASETSAPASADNTNSTTPSGSTTTTTTETVVTVEETAAPTPTPEPEPEPSYSINYPPAGTEEYELFILINEARAANGLAPLSWSGSLADCAYVRASEASEVFSHTRPDGSDWWTVNPDIMYGENLADGQTNAQWVFDDWMNSPTHRDNILGDYTTYGSARVGNTWAQEFGY